MKPCLKKTHKIIFCFVCLSLLSITLACRKGGHKLMYRSGEEAVEDYKGYLTELRNKDCMTSPEICTAIGSWMQRDLAVDKALEGSINDEKRPFPYINDFLRVRDSIKIEFERLILSEKRTYKDVLLFQEASLPFINDSVLITGAKKAEAFFTSLQSNEAYKGTTEQVLSEYRTFLNKQLQEGIHSKAEMLSFIKKEDSFFRALLQHLPDVEKLNITDITINSEKCCGLIYQAQVIGEIPENDAMTYITIRTNLRLIQNMRVCIDDTRRGRVKTPSQARAYMYMILSPYSIIDGVGMAMLSEEQKKMLFKIADDTEEVIRKLSLICDGDVNKLPDIPSLLMKIVLVKL